MTDSITSRLKMIPVEKKRSRRHVLKWINASHGET